MNNCVNRLVSKKKVLSKCVIVLVFQIYVILIHSDNHWHLGQKNFILIDDYLKF